MNTWPNGKRIAVAVTVMFETWADGTSPQYTVQSTQLKAGVFDRSGKAWTEYGANAGLGRLLRTLDRHGIPATFGVNARCAEIYPQAVSAIVESGHEIVAHGYTQDQIQAYLMPDEEREMIRRSLTVLHERTGTRPRGWMTSVLAWTEQTTGFLMDEGLLYQADSNNIDFPLVVERERKRIVAIPTSDFTDMRVLRASPRDFFDAYKGTFDFLYANEPGAMISVLLHAHSAGRPLIAAVVEDILAYFAGFPDVWFARYGEIAQHVLESVE